MRRDDDLPPDRPAGEPVPRVGAESPGETGPFEADTAHHDRLAEQQMAALRRERQARVAKVLVILVILVLFIVFIVSNSEPVSEGVDFVFVTRHPRLIWVMFGCAVFGGIIGFLIGKPGRQFGRRRSRQDEGSGDRKRR
jgi:uncharacterized integral membrane protein